MKYSKNIIFYMKNILYGMIYQKLNIYTKKEYGHMTISPEFLEVAYVATILDRLNTFSHEEYTTNSILQGDRLYPILFNIAANLKLLLMAFEQVSGYFCEIRVLLALINNSSTQGKKIINVITIQHLFISCHYARFMWRLVGRETCFMECPQKKQYYTIVGTMGIHFNFHSIDQCHYNQAYSGHKRNLWHEKLCGYPLDPSNHIVSKYIALERGKDEDFLKRRCTPSKIFDLSQLCLHISYLQKHCQHPRTLAPLLQSEFLNCFLLIQKNDNRDEAGEG
ncbi:hypothetical protein ACJX0J_024784, partial [Zea mays]